MKNKRWAYTFITAALLVMTAACSVSFTTANISSLNLGKDKGVSQPTTQFGPEDKIFVAAEVANVPGSVKVTGRLLVEHAEGLESGLFPGAETTITLPASGVASFTFSPPSVGWPTGKYKVEVIMRDETGAQKDQKTTEFSVS